jgi:hypothetical protein
LPELRDGSAESVESWARQCAEHFGFKIFGDAISRIVPELVEQAARLNGPQNAYSFAREAIGIIDELSSALYGCDAAPQFLWEHRKFPNESLDATGDIDRAQLNGVIQSYLKCEWHSAYLEWCMLDALVFWECAAFQYSNAGGRFVARIYFGIWVTLVALICAVVYWALPTVNPWLLGAIAFIAIVLGIPRRPRNRRVRDAMFAAYHHLNGIILSPARISEELIAAERIGVLWPTSVWPLLDVIIARSPTLWEPWGR